MTKTFSYKALGINEDHERMLVTKGLSPQRFEDENLVLAYPDFYKHNRRSLTYSTGPPLK